MVSTRRRAVSTVADVSLALVMISAAVVMMGLFLQDNSGSHEPMTADRSAETIAGMTLSVEYNISEIRDHSEAVTPADVEIEWPPDTSGFNRSRHGTMADLLADAAIANATYDGTRATVTGEIFREAIDGRFRTQIGGTDANVHVTAIWRPYRDSSIEGVATAGPRPPRDADVSSVTMTVPNGITLANDRGTLHSLDHDTRAKVLARQIVDYQFPSEGAIHSLESQGLAREVTVYRYYGYLTVVGAADTYEHDDDDELSRYSANPIALNEEIAVEADQSLANQMADEQRSFASDQRFADWLTIENVEIVVRTWKP